MKKAKLYAIGMGLYVELRSASSPPKKVTTTTMIPMNPPRARKKVKKPFVCTVFEGGKVLGAMDRFKFTRLANVYIADGQLVEITKYKTRLMTAIRGDK